MPSPARVAMIEPSKTSPSNFHDSPCFLPCFFILTTTPPGLRQTPSPDGRNPLVTSSPSSLGVRAGGGLGAGRATALSGAEAGGLVGGLRRRACSRESLSSSEPSSWAKNAPEIRPWSWERRMQLVQSAASSAAAKVPAGRGWPHRGGTVPLLGTRGGGGVR